MRLLVPSLFSLMVIACTAASSSAQVGGSPAEWQQQLTEMLPKLGHRNWIVIADSAYPLQARPGVETITINADHLTVVRSVLAAIEATHHVRPAIHLDAELPHVPERFAAGIMTFRRNLTQVLGNRKVESLPHEAIISKLDKAGETFRVVILKTNLTLPYTSVFIRLDCGYWSDDAENQLRAAIQGAQGSK